MMKKLNKEIIEKKTGKQMLVGALISSVAWTILLYMCLTLLNEDIVAFFNSVSEEGIELQTTLIIFPVILIGNSISLMNILLFDNKAK